MRVLFAARAVDLRGDAQVLLTFLHWLHDDEIEPVVLVGGDALAAEFGAVAETHVIFPAPPAVSASSPTRRAYNRVLGLRREVDRRRLRQRLGPIDLVYLNGPGGAAPLVERVGISDEIPVLVHLHQQAYVLAKLEHDTGNASRFIRRTDQFIAVSETGAAALRDEYQVPDSAVAIVYPFVDIDELTAQQSAVGLRELAGLRDDTFIVGAAGAVEWRKAPDLFVQVARELAHRHGDPDVAFVWLGRLSTGQRDQLQHDITAVGLHNVHFIGAQINAPALFREFDVLCMPSREDPFACVLLECAAGGVPSVRFRGADGRPVFGSSGGAIVVDYLDVNAMAQAIADLVNDRSRLHALGAQAKLSVQEFDVNVLGPQIVELIKKTARLRVSAS